MPAIDVIIKSIIKSANELKAILSKTKKRPKLTKQAEKIAKKMSFNHK